MRKRRKAHGARRKAGSRAGQDEEGVSGVKVVGIIGFKKSGKTTLGNRLSEALMNRGLKVAVFKNAAHHDVSTETDTGKYREHCHFVAALSSGGVSMFLRGARSIEEILSLAESDIVVLEGFKTGEDLSEDCLPQGQGRAG